MSTVLSRGYQNKELMKFKSRFIITLTVLLYYQKSNLITSGDITCQSFRSG